MESPVTLAERLYEAWAKESMRLSTPIHRSILNGLDRPEHWPTLDEHSKLVWDAVAKEAERAVNGD